MQRKIVVFPQEGSRCINLQLVQHENSARLQAVDNNGTPIPGGIVGVINGEGELVLMRNICPSIGLSLDSEGCIRVVHVGE